MFYAFCHNWSIVLCETKSKLFPARIPNYQAVFRKVWILYKFGFVEKSKLLDFSTMLAFWSLVLLFGIVWCWRSISCFRLLASLPYMSIRTRIIISITFQKVDHAPHAKSRPKSDYQCLQYTDCTLKKCHIFSSVSLIYALLWIPLVSLELLTNLLPKRFAYKKIYV